jgi:hypothetical protein
VPVRGVVGVVVSHHAVEGSRRVPNFGHEAILFQLGLVRRFVDQPFVDGEEVAERVLGRRGEFETDPTFTDAKGLPSTALAKPA